MQNFWINNGNTILVGVITAIVVLILSEPIKAVFRKFGHWIEIAFRAAGFGFQKKYYRSLIKSHQWLKLIGVFDRTNLYSPRLSEVYISLKLNTAKDSPKLNWDKIFDPDFGKHIVILGQPGAGKSTLLDYLVLILTGNVKNPLFYDLGKPVPVFVHLRDIGSHNNPGSLIRLIDSPANSNLEKIPSGFFKRHLRNGNCVVLLDGLDEVLDEQSQDSVVKEIIAFSNEYPDNWIITTCRAAGWKNQLQDFRRFDIQELEDVDIDRFIRAWYREVLRTEYVTRLGPSPKQDFIRSAETTSYEESRQQSEELWNVLQMNESLRRITRTPLILSLVTLVHKTRGDLPKGRSRLYKECLEILLERWDLTDKKLQAPDNASLKDKVLVLQKIAIFFLENNLLQMEVDGLESLIIPALSSLTVPIKSASLIKQICERSGILIEQSVGRYGFAHRTLHDFLSASYISENNLDQQLLNHTNEERWREVALIAAGVVTPSKRAEALVNALLLDGNVSSIALAGTCLAEDIQVDESLRESVKQKILINLSKTESVAEFQLLRNSLLEFAPASFSEWMKASILSQNIALRGLALSSLVELSPHYIAQFIPILLGLIQDKEVAPHIRSQALVALSKIKISPSEEFWKALETARKNPDPEVKLAATWAWCELGRYEELGLVYVPAGEFLMGAADNDSAANHDEKPQHTIYLPGFYIGKYPVTTQEFEMFTKETDYKPQNSFSLQGTANHPVVHVTWQDAMEYASWHGFTLPSEAEWEKAARGRDGIIFPWGNTWKQNSANTNEYWAGTRGLLSRLLRRSVDAGTTAVKTFSAYNISPYKCIDMAGNVWEWTRSLYSEYPYSSSDGREVLDVSKKLVLRGGAFSNIYSFSRASARHALAMNFPSADKGFRICVSLPAKD